MNLVFHQIDLFDRQGFVTWLDTYAQGVSKGMRCILTCSEL